MDTFPKTWTTSIVDWKTAAVAVGATFTVMGIAPVVGPGRAIGLALNSFVKGKRGPQSMRTDKVKLLRA